MRTTIKLKKKQKKQLDFYREKRDNLCKSITELTDELRTTKESLSESIKKFAEDKNDFWDTCSYDETNGEITLVRLRA